MPEFSAGSASVRIRPNADDFIRDLRRQLATTRDPGFNVGVAADITEFHEKVERAKRETSKPVKTELEVDLEEAENKLRALRIRERAKKLGIKVDVEADPAQAEVQLQLLRARQEARKIELGVDVDTRRADAQINAMRRQLEGFGRSDVFKLNLAAFGLGAIQPAVAGLVQFAAGLQQVAQSGLAVPGVISGVAASISTLAFGLFGVSDAYSAVSKAALSSGEDQAASARSSAAASNALRNAVVDESQARKDQANAYRDARQQLQDLNVEMRGGLINESRAVLEAQKAREDLAKGNYSDIRDAQLRVLEADQRVIEVRSRNAKTAAELNDANTKGVEGSDLVVAANERVVRSSQQVADAQAAAAAASGNQSAAAKAAQQAMDKLSPSAQKFVQQLVDMEPKFKQFMNSAQEPLFEGKAEEFSHFYDTLAPIAERGMARISAAWNDNITALVTTLGSSEGQGLIDRILGNTGEAQEKLSKAIEPLVMGLGTLSAAGTDALPRLADAIGNASARFANFITEADKDGRLEKWINDGLTGMTSLGESALNIGKSISSITSAAGGGASFLKWLEDVTAKMRDWLASTEGQNKVKEWLDQGLDLLEHWGELLKELPGAFQSMSNAVQPYIGSVIDLFTTLADLVGKHPDLVKAVVTAYLTWKTVNPIITGVSSAMGALSTAVTNLGTGFYPMRDKAKQAISDVDDTFKRAGNAGSGMNKFSAGLSALGSGVGAGVMGVLASVAIPGLIAALGQLDKKNQESEAQTRLLEQAQLDLEGTVDRVTGKLTAQTRDKLIQQSQNYDTTGAPGGGIPGISKGDALNAATSLGVAPDTYIDAQQGKPEALQQVRDVLLGNNLIPELSANKDISQKLAAMQSLSGGKINADILSRALLGDPDAISQYNDALVTVQRSAPAQGRSLADIAQQLSPTGQAAIMAGGRLNQVMQALPTLGDPTRQANQAANGRARLTDSGRTLFGGDYMVNATGTDFKLTLPSITGLDATLQSNNFPYKQNMDGTFEVTIPKDSPYVEKYEKGGPTHDSGGARAAIVHPREWMVNARGRASVPDSFLKKLNQGIVDPRELGHFDNGGLVDQYGNPVAPGGAAPGPLVTSTPIAPNPTAGGGIDGIVSKVISGLQGPVATAIGIGQQLSGMLSQGSGGGADAAGGAPADPGAAFAARAATLPGLAGLFGSMAIQDPAAQSAALTSWGGDTLSWLSNWGLSTASGVGDALWTGAGRGGGILGALGLQDSILSSSNKWNQAASAAGGFFMNPDGPLATLAGLGGNDKNTSTNGQVDPAALQAQYGVTLDAKTLQALYSGQGGAPGSVADLGDLLKLPDRLGGEAGLQIDTIKAKRAIEAAFPQITEIGGVRADALKWHPNGLAIDVMIPGQGGNNDPTTPEGKALGDRIYAYIMANKEALGVDYVMWQEKDHYNHLHVNTVGGGYPKMDTGGPTPSTPGPVDAKGGHLAVVHPKEFMISARGRASVPDAFLHKLNQGLVDPKDLPGYYYGGAAVPAGIVPRPVPPAPVVPARTINIPPVKPSMPAPAPKLAVPTSPTAPGGAPKTAAPVQQTPTFDQSAPVMAPTTTGGASIAAAPGSLNHNVGWVNQLIESSASNLGQLASTALSIASMGAGASGVPGAGALGAIGPFVAGGIQEVGKVVEGVANVVSSSMVGNAPGSFGGPTGANPYGSTVRPEQNVPVTAPIRQVTNNFNGVSDIARLRDSMELHDNVTAQATLANH